MTLLTKNPSCASRQEGVSLQEKMRYDANHLTFLAEDVVVVNQDDIAKARDSIIETGVKAFVKQGMTPEKALERVMTALDTPLKFNLPSIEDL